MKLKLLFQKKHELWLKLTFYLFALRDYQIKFLLESFGEIQFRHLKWLGKDILSVVQTFDYSNFKGDKRDIPVMLDFNRDFLSIKKSTNIEVINDILRSLNEIREIVFSLENRPLLLRIKSDDTYYYDRIKEYLNRVDERSVMNAFSFNVSLQSKLLSLSEREINVLVLCIKEQVYKEYKTVMSLLFVIWHITHRDVVEIFIDLIDESLIHLKHYINFMSQMGILDLPKVLNESDYKVRDIKAFVDKIIKDEESELLELKYMGDVIPNKAFQNLLSFVNAEEKYHIELLKKVKDLYKK